MAMTKVSDTELVRRLAELEFAEQLRETYTDAVKRYGTLRDYRVITEIMAVVDKVIARESKFFGKG